jgi:hypothetical protein
MYSFFCEPLVLAGQGQFSILLVGFSRIKWHKGRNSNELKKHWQIWRGGMKVEMITSNLPVTRDEQRKSVFLNVRWRLCHETGKNVFGCRSPRIDLVHGARWTIDGG